MPDLSSSNPATRPASAAPPADSPRIPTSSTARTVTRWGVTFAGFPLGGLLTDLAVGPIDGPGRAVLGGLLTGTVLGTIQTWGLGRGRPNPSGWIVASAVGLALGLLIGGHVVGYGTDRADLLAMGALCGASVGAFQALLLARSLGALVLAWPCVLAATWAIGWAVTVAAGVQVDQQFSVFGSSGALVVTALTLILPVLLRRSAHRQTRSAP